MTAEERAIEVATKWRDEAAAIFRKCGQPDPLPDCQAIKDGCVHDYERQTLRRAAVDLMNAFEVPEYRRPTNWYGPW